MIRFTYDIHTHQTVYAVCDNQGQAMYLTTSITRAINLLQNIK